VEHSTIFICYSTSVDEVVHVQMRVEHRTIFICYAT